MLLGKTKSLLSNLILEVKVVKLYALIALTDLITGILLIGIVKEENFVELNTVHLQLLNVVLSLGEA